MFARFERQRARHFEMLDVVMRRIRLRKDGSDAHVLDPRSVFLELTDRTLQCCNGFRRRLPPRWGSPYPDPWRFHLRWSRPSLPTRHHGHEQSGIGNAARHDADGIERFGERLDAMAIDRCKARFVAHHSAETGWADDGTAGLGAQCKWDHEIGYRRSGAARRATRRSRGIVRVYCFAGMAREIRTTRSPRNPARRPPRASADPEDRKSAVRWSPQAHAIGPIAQTGADRPCRRR